jgi:hypothetical protein
VLGGEPKATPATQGELELLQASGAQAVNPNIRQEIRHDYAKGTKRRSYADAILFWRSSEPNVATPLDARQEARRISTAGPVVPPAPVEQAPPVIEKGEVASAEPSVQEKKSADKAGNSRGWFDWF